MSDDEVKKALAGGTKFRAYRDEDNNENVRIYTLPVQKNEPYIENISATVGDNGLVTITLSGGEPSTAAKGVDGCSSLTRKALDLLRSARLESYILVENESVTNDSRYIKSTQGGGQANLSISLRGAVEKLSFSKVVRALAGKSSYALQKERPEAIVGSDAFEVITANEKEVKRNPNATYGFSQTDDDKSAKIMASTLHGVSVGGEVLLKSAGTAEDHIQLNALRISPATTTGIGEAAKRFRVANDVCISLDGPTEETHEWLLENAEALLQSIFPGKKITPTGSSVNCAYTIKGCNVTNATAAFAKIFQDQTLGQRFQEAGKAMQARYDDIVRAEGSRQATGWMEFDARAQWDCEATARTEMANSGLMY